MAKVTLNVDGFEEREVMMVNYSFHQETDFEGQTSGKPRGGKITIRLSALNNGNKDLINWMLTPNLKKKGYVEFFKKNDSEQSMKKLEFNDAFCADYIEYYEDNGGHWEEIVLSCREIKVGSVSFTNKWA